MIGVTRAGGRVVGVRCADGAEVRADAVVFNGDSLALARMLGSSPVGRRAPRSASGLALMLALRGRPPGRPHHEITFPADYDAELDDLFVERRPVRDPTVYVSAPGATDQAGGPEAGEDLFVLVNAPSGVARVDWDAEAQRIVDRLGIRDRVVGMRVRSPDDLALQTGALGGAIYGPATHGRLGALRRPGHRVRGVSGLWRVGGTAHPGGGIPLVLLGAATVAREVGPP